jgi:hypothetical protein
MPADKPVRTTAGPHKTGGSEIPDCYYINFMQRSSQEHEIPKGK